MKENVNTTAVNKNKTPKKMRGFERVLLVSACLSGVCLMFFSIMSMRANLIKNVFKNAFAETLFGYFENVENVEKK